MKIGKTQIAQVTIQAFQKMGIDAAVDRVLAKMSERKIRSPWLHVDLDVLDQRVMTAVAPPDRLVFRLTI